MKPLSIARWLVCPVIFVIAQWRLFLSPAGIITLVPALWDTGGPGIADMLPPHPQTRKQAFDLGWQASIYGASSCVAAEGKAPEPECAAILKSAGEALGVGPLTHEQMVNSPKLIEELDAERMARLCNNSDHP